MSPIRVMLVDDHPELRFALRAFVEVDPRMEVVAEASDGRRAVIVASSVKPDVIIMDVRMPVLNGIEATRQIMARSDRMKVVAFSAEDDTVTRQAMQDAGAASYLTKNVPPHELRATILTLMERKC